MCVSTQNITKLDAARRQLNQAIWLLFEDRDVVSIHTLACAATTILNDVAKAKKIRSFKNILEQVICPEKQGAVVCEAKRSNHDRALRAWIRHCDKFSLPLKSPQIP